MRRSLSIALVLAACGSARAPSIEKAPVPVRAAPDVIVITVDTLRADRVGAWGWADARTPAMDALAAEGVRFASAITPQPRTTPGLASLWTGLWPHHHGAREVHFPRSGGTLIAEVLHERGYATRAVSANRAAGPDTQLGDGFDRFEVETGADASVVNGLALEVAEAPEETPLLLWVHYYDPHAPYSAPAAAHPPETPRCVAVQREARWDEALSNRGGISEAAWPECSAAYDAEVAWADRHIGELVAHLRAIGRLKHAILVFTSDHGEGMGERGLWYEHGPNVHGSNLHVPLAVWAPGVEGGRVAHQAVSLVDLAPTLYDLLEVPEDARPEVDGRSFAAALRGEEDLERPVTAESSNALTQFYPHGLIVGRGGAGYCLNGPRFAFCWDDPRDAPRLYDREPDPMHEVDVAAEHPGEYAALAEARRRWAWSYGREHAARDARYKLVAVPRVEGGYRRALYDLETDPTEARDVAADHPAILERLGAALDAWERDLPGYEPPIALSPEQEEALRALGYIE